MAAVVARFYVSGVTKRQYGTGDPWGEVELQAATRGAENREWASATPSGTLKMTVRNGDAFDWFDKMLGQDVAITFDAAPPPD